MIATGQAITRLISRRATLGSHVGVRSYERPSSLRSLFGFSCAKVVDAPPRSSSALTYSTVKDVRLDAPLLYVAHSPPTIKNVILSSSVVEATPEQPVESSLVESPESTKITAAEEKEIEDELQVLERIMFPREVVAELDRYIVGQTNAKRAVAIALRNRWRYRQLPQHVREEVAPKNILMIGPTGVGKTEIARRIARLSNAPFVKVEATKFTELGFVGRDVDSIVQDLMDISVQQTKDRLYKRYKKKTQRAVENKLLDLLLGSESIVEQSPARDLYRAMLNNGELDSRIVEMTVKDKFARSRKSFDINNPFNTYRPHHARTRDFSMGYHEHSALPMKEEFIQRTPSVYIVEPELRKRSLTIAECRTILTEQEIENVVKQELIIQEAKEMVEHNGIVFIDEIDKICSKKGDHQGNVSDEGVQRDLLPLIEGCIVPTRFGNVDTSKILFIASGAFLSCKPSDLLAELQGRLPIRVELKSLSKDDLYRILTEPEFNLIRQQTELMKTEGVRLVFTDAALREIAKIAAEVNSTVENIGARRLHTVIERLMEDTSFNCGMQAMATTETKTITSLEPTSPLLPATTNKQEELTLVEIDAPLVRQRVGELLLKTDLSRFIL